MRAEQLSLILNEVNQWSTIVCSVCTTSSTIQSGSSEEHFYNDGWRVVDGRCVCFNCQDDIFNGAIILENN